MQTTDALMKSAHPATVISTAKPVRSYAKTPAAVPVQGRPCFGRGTLVTLPDRQTRPIQSLRPGDRVLSYIPAACRFVESTVDAIVPGPERVTQQMIVVNGHLITAPASGIYADEEGQYLAALVLRLGQGLRTVEEITIGIKSLEAIATGRETFEVRLEGEVQTFFANGLLVQSAQVAGWVGEGGRKVHKRKRMTVAPHPHEKKREHSKFATENLTTPIESEIGVIDASA